jgi:type IV pilus assembly protein PilM
MTGKIASRAIGLDIGTSGVRAAELRHIRGSDSFEVSRLAAVDLPHGTVRNGEVLNPKLFTKALRSLWKKGRFAGRSVTFGISDTSIITRQLDLPWMPPESFIQALPYQINEVLPVDISTVELDYHLLKQVPGRDALGQETLINRILVVASNRASLTAEAQLIRKAGLTPICADSAAFALIRAACHGKIPKDDRLRVIADIGAEQLTVVIHQNGQPRFIRTISNFGGDSATDAIVNLLDLRFDDAEKIKRSTGLNGPLQLITAVPESSVFRNISSVDPGSLDLTTQSVIKLLNPLSTTLIK